LTTFGMQTLVFNIPIFIIPTITVYLYTYIDRANRTYQQIVAARVARCYIFKPKPVLGKFWCVLQWKMLVFFVSI
jgi:hypothetical protein